MSKWLVQAKKSDCCLGETEELLPRQDGLARASSPYSCSPFSKTALRMLPQIGQTLSVGRWGRRTDAPRTAGSFPSPPREQSTASDPERGTVELEGLYTLTQQRGRDETPRHTPPHLLRGPVSQPYTKTLHAPRSHQHGPCTGTSHRLTPAPRRQGERPRRQNSARQDKCPNGPLQEDQHLRAPQG